MEKLDCMVLGAGIAGITAGIYLKRGNVEAKVFDKGAPGGKLNNIHRIDNYPGTAKIAGPDLAAQLFSQADELGVVFDYADVLDVRNGDGLFHVFTDMGEFEAIALIVATGVENTKLGIPGESELVGKGVSYCATCDGAFFKGKDVVVYGEKDHAVEDAIYLSSLAKTVYVLSPGELQTTEAHHDELLGKENVKVILGAKLLSVLGDTKVTGVAYEKDGEETTLPADGLFQLCGEKSSSQFLASLGLTMTKGFINVDANMATNVPGLFAAGDVVNKKLRQLVNAAGEAAVAATSAMAYVRAKKRAK